LARGLLHPATMAPRTRAPRPGFPGSLVALGLALGAGLALGGCPGDSVPAEPEALPPETLDGTPCDQPGIVSTGVECEQCVCTDEGVLHCPRTTCASYRVLEATAGLLLVVDDSSSMGPDRQARLAAAMPAFLAELDAYPNPVALRVGVTTTSHSSPACDPATVDDGALQLRSCLQRADDFAVPAGPTEEPIPADAAARACGSVCTLPQLRTVPSAVPGSVEPRARPWLERYADHTNLEGDVDFAAALACAIPQGLHGCDFESPLRSAVAALRRGVDFDDLAGGFAAPGIMTVLVVTDEDDCSAAEEWGTVFDPEGSRRFWSDPEADAPTSAVCWNAGVVCEGGPGTYDSCEPANIDTAEHVGVPRDNAILTPVGTLLDELHDVDGARQTWWAWDSWTEVEVIGGVPSGYGTNGIGVVYTDGQDDPDHALRYGVGPGCRDDDESAVPPPRLLEVPGPTYSACDDDYGPALAAVGRRIVERLGPPCYWDCAADADPGAAGLQPTCWAHEEWIDAQDGSLRQQVVSPCDGDQLPPGAELCLLVRHDEALSSACADDGFNLELGVLRDPAALRPWGSAVRVICEPSDDRARDCPGLG
jgi:hypothetical protein